MKTIHELKNLLISTFPEQRIYLFGSRAREHASVYSDYDIAIESTAPIRDRLTRVKEQIDASSIPYKIDLVDLSQAPHLRAIVQAEGIRWH